ncbi:aspartate-semialdehyde dehydrogenase [Candidatus Woesearchaeota archaeon]|nr:aspartate-semialdehyde dehydrogenase [Candidatus Woesearchaeota archaeon]
MNKIKVGILGATGMVGQRFIDLLQSHPWFEIAELAASEKSAGKTYEEAMEGRWKVSAEIPNKVRKMKVKECKPNLDCRIIFSALDSSVAGPIEEEFAKNGYVVSSNSRNHRMDNDVPLLIPEVNPEHLSIIKKQKQRFGKGFIVTNPNCSAMGLVMALKPLQDAFGLKKVFVTTMQAVSGAGYPGVASLDVLDNVVPYIGGEEEKMESESLKLLGNVKNDKFVYADIKVSAQCNRVNVKDGHLEAVNVELGRKATLDEIKNAFKNFNPLKKLNLPSAPNPPIIVREEIDRPQPKYDRDLGNGMAVAVGRIRKCNILDYRFLVLSHNTIRGAAGAAILNAELMKVKGVGLNRN